MLEPNVIVLYVDNISRSCEFYERLLSLSPVEASPTFCMFTHSNGMSIGLKDKHSIQINDHINGGCELAFTVDNLSEVNRLFLDWQQKAITISKAPHSVPFGYTFTAHDPDHHRLRVVAVSK